MTLSSIYFKSGKLSKSFWSKFSSVLRGSGYDSEILSCVLVFYKLGILFMLTLIKSFLGLYIVIGLLIVIDLWTSANLFFFMKSCLILKSLGILGDWIDIDCGKFLIFESKSLICYWIVSYRLYYFPPEGSYPYLLTLT